MGVSSSSQLKAVAPYDNNLEMGRNRIMNVFLGGWEHKQMAGTPLSPRICQHGEWSLRRSVLSSPPFRRFTSRARSFGIEAGRCRALSAPSVPGVISSCRPVGETAQHLARGVIHRCSVKHPPRRKEPMTTIMIQSVDHECAFMNISHECGLRA